MSKEIVVKNPQMIRFVNWLGTLSTPVRALVITTMSFIVMGLGFYVSAGIYYLFGLAGLGVFALFVFIYVLVFVGLLASL